MTRQKLEIMMISIGYKARENIRRNVSFLMEQLEIRQILIIIGYKRLKNKILYAGKNENPMPFNPSDFERRIK